MYGTLHIIPSPTPIVVFRVPESRQWLLPRGRLTSLSIERLRHLSNTQRRSEQRRMRHTRRSDSPLTLIRTRSRLRRMRHGEREIATVGLSPPRRQPYHQTVPGSVDRFIFRNIQVHSLTWLHSLPLSIHGNSERTPPLTLASPAVLASSFVPLPTVANVKRRARELGLQGHRRTGRIKHAICFPSDVVNLQSHQHPGRHLSYALIYLQRLADGSGRVIQEA